MNNEIMKYFINLSKIPIKTYHIGRKWIFRWIVWINMDKKMYERIKFQLIWIARRSHVILKRFLSLSFTELKHTNRITSVYDMCCPLFQSLSSSSRSRSATPDSDSNSPPMSWSQTEIAVSTPLPKWVDKF